MNISTINDILSLWPSMYSISADTDIGYDTIKKWKKRQSIPVKYWQPLILAAADRGKHLSCHSLMKAHTK